MRFSLILAFLPFVLAIQSPGADASEFAIPALVQHSRPAHGHKSHASHPSLLAPPTPRLAKRSSLDSSASSIEERGIKEGYNKAVANVKSGAEWTKGKIVKVFT